jgi:cyclophilin family peptidyl-prolyl cis-trans isomerase
MKLFPFNKKTKCFLLATSLSIASVFTATPALATIVQFQTNMGRFDVNLYDERTPNTVANFLAYVNAGDYSDSISHRAVSDFIVQGGGFVYNNSWPVDSVSSNAAVVNEPVFSNVRGTIAMAKLSGNPNSATNQWFFNLVDNSGGGAQLDSQNSGFTVFGEVMTDGMTVVDQIGDLPTFNFGGALAELPLQNFANNGTDPDATNLVIITSIIVLDASADTASALSPPLNTSASTPPPTTPPTSSGGGGSMGSLLMGLVLLLGLRRKGTEKK